MVEWSDYHCDHVQPLDQRPDLAFDEANLQVMHARCHRRKTAKGE
jgi:5-methylcytosine-specific restriction endonuclease McrA